MIANCRKQCAENDRMAQETHKMDDEIDWHF